MHVDSTRRTIVKAALALAAAPVTAACACPAARPAAAPIRPTGLAPLAPARVQAKAVPLAFDVHAHLFNATDVPVAGYLAGPVAHSWPLPLRSAVRAAAPFVERLAQRFPISCGEEMDEIRKLLGRTQGLAPAAASAALRAEIDANALAHLDELEAELVRELPRSEFGRVLDEADRRSRAAQRFAPPARPLSRDPERIALALRRGRAGPSVGDPSRKSRLAIQEADADGVLAFVGNMLSLRHHNLRAFQQGYTEADGAFGIDACFASLVDFDYWLDCERTASSLRDQVLLHEQLAMLSGGYVLPLVPYNPWTDIARDGASLALVKEAVEKHGFVGVKVYPPMGFQPLGNEKIRSRLRRPPLEQLDKRLEKLYAWCAAEQVPVMAHTAHSMGRDSAHDGLSAPVWWDKVVTQFPGLRINAGHFGGDHHAKGEDWPREFVALMGTGRGSRFYADLGFADALFNPKSPTYARTAGLLAGPLAGAGSASVHSRIMYGSDWLMLSRLPRWEDYAHAVERFLRSVPGLDHAAALRSVFFDSAAHCYGLRAGEATRARLERFYRDAQVPLPAWMGALDREGPA